MKYQPWLGAPDWERTEPKLVERSVQPAILSHTASLLLSIPVRPAGILLLRGPRQVGKSTFLREFAAKCLAEGIEPESVVMYDAERFENRHVLLGELELFFEHRRRFSVVLIDELSAIDQWWLVIKILADEGKLSNVLLLGTGSSSMDISRGADLMPGRRGRRHPVDFELLPVPYRMVSDRLSIEQYLLTGGFPWAINEYLRLGSIPAYVYQLYSSWIEGAFHRQGHTIQHVSHLANRLSRQVGSPISILKLTRDCGIGSNHTTEAYLDLLEKNFVLIPTYWTSVDQGVPAPRKNRKFYPLDPFLFHIFADMGRGWDMAFDSAKRRQQDPSLVGGMVEALVASELRRRNGRARLGYWLGRKEIDFVGTNFVEVKYQTHVSVDEFAWSERVLPKGRELTVVTKNDNARKGRIRLVDLKRWLSSDA
jgi:predicted AAA+ superfamily ATPase